MINQESKSTVAKRACALLLSVLMVFGSIGLFASLIKTDAATAGTYYVRVNWQVDNTRNTNDNELTVYYYKQDGTSATKTINNVAKNSGAQSDDWELEGVPYRFYVKVYGTGAKDASQWYLTKITVSPNSNYTSNATTIFEGKVGCYVAIYLGGYQDFEYDLETDTWIRSGTRTKTKITIGSSHEKQITTDGFKGKPAASSITAISGVSSVAVPTDGGTTTKSYTGGTVKDQYGVNWYQDPTLSMDATNGCTFSNNTLSVPASANRANNYTVTIKETCGDASNTKAVTITTFDYKVTFYDEDGSTVLKSEQTIDYGGSATAPENPTKAYDSTNHYDFDGWTGDGYTAIKTGAQTKTVKASYKGTPHDAYLKWVTTDSTHQQVCSVCGYVKVAETAHNFGAWTADTATCTAAGSHSRTCTVCGHTVTEATSALGHHWVTTVNADHLVSAADCESPAVYHKWCDRCGANHPTETFTNGSALGHDWDYANASYSWTGTTACTATIHCKRNAAHTTTESATVTSAVTTVATCATDGIKTYTATFSNSQLATQTKTENLGKDPSNHTNLTHTAANAATCLASGNIEYWYCAGCGKYFSDAAATKEITQAQTVTAKLAHSYTGAVKDNGNGTHSFLCVNGCGEYGGTVNCTYGAWQDAGDGTQYRECSVCHHRETQTNHYTVTFDGNGATGGSTADQSFVYGTAQNLNANGYTRAYTVTFVHNNGAANTTATATATFNGWATAANGDAVYSDGQNVNNLTAAVNGVFPLYANWTLGSVALPTPSNPGYGFAGWFTDSAFTNEVSGASFTPTENTTLYAKWVQICVDDLYVLDTGLAVKLDVLSNDQSGAALKSVTQGAGYTTAISEGKVVFTPTAVLNAAVQFSYTATYQGADFTAQVTVLPATNVYYEEDFVTFDSSEVPADYAWQDAGSEYTGKFQDGARPGDADSPVYGYDAAYDNNNSVTYSLGNAKWAKVDKTVKKGAKASFTFTGTGFDLYAVTNHEVGLVFVDVDKIENGTETNLYADSVNAYYGYQYGQMYLKDGKVTLDATGKAIYYAPDGQEDGTFFVRGQTRGWTTPTYYASGNVITEGTGANPAYAYGWVAESAGGSGLYQVPVISYTGLDYGTYRVTVQPRYSARQDLTGTGEYRFYVDSVRVYDPIDPSTVTSGTAAYDAYTADHEYGATYQSLRALILDAQTFDASNTLGEKAGVAFLELVETGKDPMASYEAIGPKNELYLESGQAIAFNLTTASTQAPAKLSLGVKMAVGTSGTVNVMAAQSVNYTVTGATDLYRDITAAVEWTLTGSSQYTTTQPIVITNNSGAGAVISLTKLKWSYAGEAPAAARQLRFSIRSADLKTASSVMRQLNVKTAAPDVSKVQILWNTELVQVGQTALLMITAPDAFEHVFVDGQEIAGYTELANGMRQWTYRCTPERAGSYAFDVTLKDGGDYATDPIRTAALQAEQASASQSAAANGRTMVTLQQLLQTIFGRLLSFLKLDLFKGLVK